MINTITTIVPIFVIILLGWLARVFGFMRTEFIEAANRLVFYLAIPAMFFRSISWTSLGNPIIVSAVAGMFVSLTALPIPLVLGRCLDILSDLALPLALLIIGASLSFKMVPSRLKAVLSNSLLKLLLMPAVGWVLFYVLDLESEMILAAPTATVTYVMAKEMHGDSQFAVVAISVNTLLSAATYTIWLSLVGR